MYFLNLYVFLALMLLTLLHGTLSITASKLTLYKNRVAEGILTLADKGKFVME